jgi:adenosylcobinamide-GDP ribazoletransferase
MINLFLLALTFLTRLPWPFQLECEPEQLKRSAAFFPLVGLLLGTLLALLGLALEQFFSLNMTVILLVLLTLYITGALHEDGLADSVDAFGGGWSLDRKLAIMKDSSIGTYGVLALVVVILLRWQGLLELNSLINHWWYLPLFFCLSRLNAVLVMQCLPYARNDDSSKSKDFTGRLSALDLTLAILPCLILFTFLPWLSVLILMVVSFSVLAGLVAYFKWQIQGYTGDCLGFAQQSTEVILILASLVVLMHA